MYFFRFFVLLCMLFVLPVSAGTLADYDMWIPNGPVYAVSDLKESGSFYENGVLTYATGTSGAQAYSLLSLPSGAAEYNWPDINGPVYAAVSDGADGWYLGGDFDTVGGQTRNNLVHLDASGAVTAWDPNATGPVRALIRNGTTLYVGGEFRSVDGINASIGGQPRNYLAALSVAGSTAVATNWDPSPNGAVLTMADNGTKLFVAGDFTVIDSQARNRLAAFLISGGSIDAWDPDANARVQAVVIDGSGDVYIAGGFTTLDGGAVSRNYVARVDGILGDVDTGWDADVDGVVHALALNGTSLYLGGDFSQVNVGTTPVAQKYLAAVGTGSGTVDLSWNPVLNAPVQALHMDSSNQLYVGGVFSQIDNQQRHRLASFDFDMGGGSLNDWKPETLSAVTMLTSSASDLIAGGGFDDQGTGGRMVFIGGDFDYVGPSTGAGVAIDADPVSGAYSDVLADWPVIDGPVYAAVADGSGGWYIGGDFSHVVDSVGDYVRNNLVHINAAGAVTAWDPGVVNNPVRSLALTSMSSPALLYVGGTFTSIGGTSRNRIAALDATNGSVQSWDPGANGAVLSLVLSSDDATLYAGGEFTSISDGTAYVSALNTTTGLVATGWSNGANATVQALALSSDDANLYAGGDFTAIGGASLNRIAVLDTTDGSANSSWDPNANGSVRALELDGTMLYVGGDFRSIDGIVSSIGGEPRNYLAALDVASGSADAGWNPSPDGQVYSLALSADNATLYVGGKFHSIASLIRSRLAAFATSGNTITAWNPAAGANIYTLAEVGNVVFAGGAFQSVGGVMRGNLAAIDDDPDSTAYGQALAWQSDADGIVRSLRVSPDQTALFVGGEFSVIGGQSRQRLARLDARTGFVEPWNAAANDTVRDIEILPTGVTLFVGGDFTSIGGQNISGLAEVAAQNGSVLTPRPDVDGQVYAMARAGSTLYVAGLFNSLGGGAELRQNLAAINLTNYSVEDWNPGTDGLVRALAASDDSLFVGGDFTEIGVNKLSRSYLGAIDPQTGDATTWSPDSNNRIDSLALSADFTSLYAGGEFTTINSVVRHHVAALQVSDGALITDDGSGADWDPDANDAVYVVKRPADSNRLFVAGNFTQISSRTLRHVAVLTPLSLDSQSPTTSASPAGTSFNSLNNQAIKLICDDGNGSGCRTTYYSINGGAFEVYSGPVLLSQDTILQFYSVDDLGNVEAAINTEVYNVELNPPESSISPGVHVFDKKSLMITLSCTDDVSGCAATYYTLDNSKPTLSSNLYTGPFRIHDSTVIKYFSVDNAGNLEGFRRASYVSIYYGGGMWGPGMLILLLSCLLWRVPRVIGKSSLLTLIVALCLGQVGPSRADTLPEAGFPSANGPVYSMLIRQGILYIGGSFTLVGGETRNNIAAINLSDGTVVADWDPVVDGTVHDMVVSTDGCDLYVGGEFSTITKTVVDSRNRVAAIGIKSNCSHYGEATSWAPDVSGNAVYGLALSADGTILYLGGDFSSVNLTARNNLAAIGTADAATIPWNPGANAPVRSLLLNTNDGTLYAGGDFTTIGGELRTALAALSPVADQARSWAPSLAGASPSVQIMLLNNDRSQLYVGGDFASIDSTTRNNLAAFTTADGALTGWNSGADDVVRAIRLSPDEARLYVGGDFLQLGASSDGRAYLGAVDTTTGEATAWSPVVDNWVRQLLTQGDDVYVGGEFTDGVQKYSMVPPVTTPDLAPGAFTSGQTVNLSCIDDRGVSCDSGIRYTDDGTDPLTSGTVKTGTGPIATGLATTVIRFYSVDDEGTQEAVKSARYAIDTQAPVSTADPDGSSMPAELSIATGNQVSLLCEDIGDAGCDAVYYTADGTDPAQIPADLYSGPVTLPEGGSTLKFFAVDLAGNSEETVGINTSNFDVDTVQPVVTPSHLSGTYTDTISVTLSCDDFSGSGCNTIYYTLDGTPPDTGSPLVYDPVNPPLISTGTIMRVYATDFAGNGSALTGATDQDIFVYTFTDPASKARQHTGAGGLDYVTLLIMLLLPVCRSVRQGQ